MRSLQGGSAAACASGHALRLGGLQQSLQIEGAGMSTYQSGFPPASMSHADAQEGAGGDAPPGGSQSVQCCGLQHASCIVVLRPKIAVATLDLWLQGKAILWCQGEAEPQPSPFLNRQGV